MHLQAAPVPITAVAVAADGAFLAWLDREGGAGLVDAATGLPILDRDRTFALLSEAAAHS